MLQKMTPCIIDAAARLRGQERHALVYRAIRLLTMGAAFPDSPMTLAEMLPPTIPAAEPLKGSARTRPPRLV